jgi:hypothetical protein
MLEAEIAKLTGKKVRARYEQDASLLGGAVVQVGSTIYDGSVNGQLDRKRSSWWRLGNRFWLLAAGLWLELEGPVNCEERKARS